MIFDLHTHCKFSADSGADPRDMIISAIHGGLNAICFTDHMDYDFPYENITFDFDTDEYFQTLTELKKEFYKEIEVLIGVELGMQPHLAAKHTEYLNSYPFDFCIGSSHVVDRFDPYYPEYFEDKPEWEAYNRYYESILENVKAFSGFDVYGHLDYILRYGPSRNTIYGHKNFFDIIDEILKAIISAGKGIELNTAGFRYDLGHPNPEESIILRYKELGGEIITVGSDAHRALDVASNMVKAHEILKECGFKYHTIFKQRTPEFIKL